MCYAIRIYILRFFEKSIKRIFIVFEELCQEFNVEDAKYLAFDLKIKLTDTEELHKLFEDFCKENDITILYDTHDGLVEKGYIENSSFKEGYLIVFEDESLSEDELVTSAYIWRSGLGAAGGNFTITLSGEKWKKTAGGIYWVS